MRLLVSIFLVPSLLLARAPIIVSDLSGANIRYRRMIGTMGQAEFIKMATALLSPKAVTVGMLALYESPYATLLAGPLRGLDHCGYDQWRWLIDRHNAERSGCPAVQQAVKVGSSIIYRGVDRNCHRNTHLLQGVANPLEIGVADKRAEVLELSFSQPTGKANVHRISVEFYIRSTGPVSIEAAKMLTAQVKAATDATYLSVVLRSDKWFIDVCQFPAWYPFESVTRLPSKDEWRRTSYAGCSVTDRWPVRCFEAASPNSP